MAGGPDKRSLLDLLGVDEQAQWDEVRRAFREAVRASHPDVHAGDPHAEPRLKELNAAWDQVNTPGKWAQYVLPSAAGAGPAADPTLGQLEVRRHRHGSAGLRRWNIELDGEVAGNVANGAISRLEAEPGRHRVRVFYERYSSPELEIELRAGEQLILGCRQHPKAMLSVYAPKRSLLLEFLGRGRAA
jgi:hypothetical protein